MTVDIGFRDYDTFPQRKSTMPLGGEDRLGYFRFSISPKGGFSEIKGRIATHLGDWKKTVFGNKGLVVYELFPGVEACTEGLHDLSADKAFTEGPHPEPSRPLGWQIRLVVRDYTNPDVMQTIMQKHNPDYIAEAESIADEQAALQRDLRAHSVPEAVGAKLLAYLLKADQVDMLDARQFMAKEFGTPPAQCNVMLERAQKAIAVGGPDLPG